MLPIVWLLGTSGVGKSTVGYRLLSELADHGTRAAFVDADQLRLAANVAASETQLIAAGLHALLPGYREAGARALIVAGLADDQAHLAALLPEVPRERILACHLDAEASALRERIRRRGWLVELTEQAVDYAGTIDPDLADLRIDTTELASDEVVRRLAGDVLRHVTRGSTGPRHEVTEPATVDAATRVVLVTGAGGVGSSTIGYQIFSRLAKAGHGVAYLDAHQLGFVGAEHQGRRLAWLRARHARAAIGAHAAHGARVVVVSAGLAAASEFTEVAQRDGLDVVSFSLRAAPPTIAERITRRARGDGPPIAGDHRRGLAGDELAASISASIEEAERAGGWLPRAHPVPTDDREPADVAASIVRHAGFAVRGV